MIKFYISLIYMSTSDDFIQQFEASMARLADIKRAIQGSIQMKEQFSNNIKDNLSQINARLKDLTGQILTLKQTADQLQLQVNTNNSSIGDKDQQLSDLQAKMQELQTEKENAINQLNQEKADLINQANQKQQQIDQLESQLREVTTLKDNLTAERDALRNELQGKGDQSQQHSDAIQKLTQDAQQREADLNNKINECDARIQQIQLQLTEKDNEINKLNQKFQAKHGETQNTSQELQKQIDQLTQQNEQLIQRIVQATQAINEAADQLDAISNGVPNAQTQQEVAELLEQIEKSLENIGRAIQGRSAAAGPSGQNQQQTLTQSTVIPLTDISNQTPINVSFEQIVNELKDKSRIGGSQGEKYRVALSQLRNATEPADVAQILSTNNIAFKNGKIMGGRRTKKNRKQKGGFTYKSTSKRRSITSTQKSSRRSSRRSSR